MKAPYKKIFLVLAIFGCAFLAHYSFFRTSGPVVATQKVTLTLQHEGQLYSGSVIKRTEMFEKSYFETRLLPGGFVNQHYTIKTGDNPFVVIPDVGTILSRYSSVIYGDAIIVKDSKFIPNPEVIEFSATDEDFPWLIALADPNDSSSSFDFIPGPGSKIVIETVSNDTPVELKIRELLPWINTLESNESTGLVSTGLDGNRDYHVSPRELTSDWR